MKRISQVCMAFVLAGGFMAGCAGMKSQPAPPIAAPNFDAAGYEAKVDNFVVVLDGSSSMAQDYNGIRKFDTAVKVVEGLNSALPELGYTGALVAFGPEVEGRETSLAYGPAGYSTAGFGQALASVAGPAGNTPLGRAIEEAGAALQKAGAAGGKTAVIVVSDGKEPRDSPMASAGKFKADVPGACFYTVLVGDDAGGKALLEVIAGETGCGFASTAGDLYSSSGMGGFVERVFLTEKQALPKPVAKPAPRGAPCVDSDRDGVCDDADRCPNTPAGATVDARGCWALKGEVLFDFDSSVIKPKAYPLLDEVAKILDMNPGLKAIFEGHTDSVCAAAYNQRLSERRADAVMRYVLGKGVPAGQVSAVGYGEQRPAASNDTEQGRAMNRRVEITPDK